MSNPLKTVIIDDDPLSTEVVTSLIDDVENIELVGSFNDPVEAVKFLSTHLVDVLILDVEMPKINGLEIIDNIDQNPFVILISGKKEYALEAFDYDVVDYITKPPTLSRFLKAVDKVKERIHGRSSGPSSDHIFLKVDSQLVNFKLSEFYFFEAYGDYVKAHVKDKFVVIKHTLSSVEKKLPDDQFLRVHRSYIVRLDKISNIEASAIEIKGQIIPIGGSFKDVLMRRIRTL